MPRDGVAHSVTGNMPLQTTRLATATTGWSSVIFIWSVAAGHGPAGSFVVSVSVTLPAAMSDAEGVYVGLSVEAFGVNVPAPPLHVPLIAPPRTLPLRCADGLEAHARSTAPASAHASL